MRPKVTQPSNYQRSLFPHQLTSVFNMEKLERDKKVDLDGLYTVETQLGIQADPTGYGKTASMIGLIVRDKMKWKLSESYVNTEIHLASPGIQITRTMRRDRLPCTLVVVSQSLVGQWRDELALSELKFEVVRTRKKAASVEPSQWDVIVCTPTMYNQLVQRFSTNFAWKRFIYDEPGTTQIRSMQTIQAGFFWLVTATPELVRYRYTNRRNHFLARLALSYLENIFFGALCVENPISYVEESWAMPAIRHEQYECFQPLARCIRGLVPQRAEELIAAGNVRGAIQYLGGEETDSIVELVRARLQEELEEAIHRIARYTRRGDSDQIESWETRKTRIESRMTELDSRFSDALKGDCPICLNHLSGPTLVPCCQNLLCGKCLLPWLNERASCPLCRTSIVPDQLVYIKKDDEEDREAQKKNTGDRKLTKCETIVNIIQKNEEGKFIIFSSEDVTFNLIREVLQEQSISCKEIKGRSESREKSIKQFKSGEIKVIFLNSSNNGAGINLQECTDIILYHEMTECVQTQILGRANRIGRIEHLIVHHLNVAI